MVTFRYIEGFKKGEKNTTRKRTQSATPQNAPAMLTPAASASVNYAHSSLHFTFPAAPAVQANPMLVLQQAGASSLSPRRFPIGL